MPKRSSKLRAGDAIDASLGNAGLGSVFPTAALWQASILTAARQREDIRSEDAVAGIMAGTGLEGNSEVHATDPVGGTNALQEHINDD